MYRLLLISGLLVVLYFLVRSVVREAKADGGKGWVTKGQNQMVQDPMCHVYVPRGSAVSEQIGGQTYFFCSRNCAQEFQKQLSG
jgi:YHS domain-containing protein